MISEQEGSVGLQLLKLTRSWPAPQERMSDLKPPSGALTIDRRMSDMTK
jgi:hypothetical protein